MANNCATKTLLIHLTKPPADGGYDPLRSDERVFSLRLGADVVASLVEVIEASEMTYPVVERFVEVINNLWRHDYGCGIIDGDDAEEISEDDVDVMFEPDDDSAS